MLFLPSGHGHQDVSSAPRAARFASCPWLESICYRRRTRALKSAAGAQIRGSGSSGLAARPRSRRCSGCCDSIHPPAGHIYQCVPSLERAEYEIAMCWQLGERRTGGAAIQRTWGAANRGSQRARGDEPRGVPSIFCMFAACEIVFLLISTCLSVRFLFSYFCAEQIWRRGSVLFCTNSRKTTRLRTGLQIKSLNCIVDLTTVAGRGPRKDGWPSAGLRRSTRTQAVPVGRLLPPCLPSNLAIFFKSRAIAGKRR